MTTPFMKLCGGRPGFANYRLWREGVRGALWNFPEKQPLQSNMLTQQLCSFLAPCPPPALTSQLQV